jgi:hypothetical protein
LNFFDNKVWNIIATLQEIFDAQMATHKQRIFFF